MLPKLIPVTEVKRKATEIIEGLQREQEPLLITEHGREAAILMDVATYRMQERKIALLEGIIRGRQAVADGRVLGHEEVLARTAKWA
jgi:prevent-host-death family protein